MKMPSRNQPISYLIAMGLVLSTIKGVQSQCPVNNDGPVVNICDYISLGFTNQVLMRLVESDIADASCLANCTITNDANTEGQLVIGIENRSTDNKCATEILVSEPGGSSGSLTCTTSNYLYITVRQDAPISLAMVVRRKSMCVKLSKTGSAATTAKLNLQCGTPEPFIPVSTPDPAITDNPIESTTPGEITSTEPPIIPSEAIITENDEFPGALVGGLVGGLLLLLAICGVLVGVFLWRKRKRDRKPHFLLNNTISAATVNSLGSPHLHRNSIDGKPQQGTLQLVLSFPSDKPFSEADVETATNISENEHETPGNEITFVKSSELKDDNEKIPFPPNSSDGYLHNYDASLFAPSIKLRYPSLNLLHSPKETDTLNYRSAYPGYLPHSTASLDNNPENDPGFNTIDSKDGLYSIPLRKGERMTLTATSRSGSDIDV